MKRLILISSFALGIFSCSSDEDPTVDENTALEASEEEEAAKPEAEAEANAPTQDPETAAASEGSEASEGEETVAEGSEEAVSSDDATPPAPEAVASEQASAQVSYPTTSHLNIRSGPGMSHSVVRIAKFGEGINLTGEKQGIWVKTTDGSWVSSLYLSSSVPSGASDPAPTQSDVGVDAGSETEGESQSDEPQSVE